MHVEKAKKSKKALPPPRAPSARIAKAEAAKPKPMNTNSSRKTSKRAVKSMSAKNRRTYSQMLKNTRKKRSLQPSKASKAFLGKLDEYQKSKKGLEAAWGGLAAELSTIAEEGANLVNAANSEEPVDPMMASMMGAFSRMNTRPRAQIVSNVSLAPASASASGQPLFLSQQPSSSMVQQPFGSGFAAPTFTFGQPQTYSQPPYVHIPQPTLVAQSGPAWSSSQQPIYFPAMAPAGYAPGVGTPPSSL